MHTTSQEVTNSHNKFDIDVKTSNYTRFIIRTHTLSYSLILNLCDNIAWPDFSSHYFGACLNPYLTSLHNLFS